MNDTAAIEIYQINTEYKKCFEHPKWTKEDSITVIMKCAELALPIFENRYPNDKRPRNAIKKAEIYFKNFALENTKYSLERNSFGNVGQYEAWSGNTAAYAAAQAAYEARAESEEAAENAALAAHETYSASCAASSGLLEETAQHAAHVLEKVVKAGITRSQIEAVFREQLAKLK